MFNATDCILHSGRVGQKRTLAVTALQEETRIDLKLKIVFEKYVQTKEYLTASDELL